MVVATLFTMMTITWHVSELSGAKSNTHTVASMLPGTFLSLQLGLCPSSPMRRGFSVLQLFS